MSPSATPATQKCRGVTCDKRAKRATHCHECHACHAKRGCEIAPRLPREIKVDVTKCHACHAKVSRPYARPSGPKRALSAMSATPATQNDRGCEIVPRLPCEIKVDVTKCHACHAKVPRRHARPSGPKRATHCHECHACHAKRPWL